MLHSVSSVQSVNRGAEQQRIGVDSGSIISCPLPPLPFPPPLPPPLPPPAPPVLLQGNLMQLRCWLLTATLEQIQ